MSPEVTLAALLQAGRPREGFHLAAEEESLASQEMLTTCARQLASDGVSLASPVAGFFVPGRIEVLGKHTDYAGGRSLLAAVERGICILATPRDDDQIVVSDALTRAHSRFRFSADIEPQPGWLAFPRAVARRLARNFPGEWRGADIAFASNLPPAAGMSSSSALLIAIFLSLAEVNALDTRASYRQTIRTREQLAEYLAAIESGSDYGPLSGDLGVGTKGGSQDHAAILCARPGELVQYAFAPLRRERVVPLPATHAFVIAVTGVKADKTGAERQRYNRTAEQMRQVAEIWRARYGGDEVMIGSVVQADPSATARLRSLLREQAASAVLLARAEQFIAESQEIVPAAADSLARGDLVRFGEVVDRSQQLATTALGNQVEETIQLAHSARQLGATAASAFGAGFGGSVWAFVEESRQKEFLDAWRSAYLARFPQRAAAAEFFKARAGPPARRLA